MLEKMFAPILRFFGIIASSLTGVTALFTAVGFLAERSHLYMLGFTSIPVDLNQYLYTGARFFAYLPILLLSTLGLGVLDVARKYLQVFAASLLALLLLNLLFRIQPLRNFKRWLLDCCKTLVHAHRTGLLFLLIFLQFIGIYHLLITTQVTNLLFVQRSSRVSNALFPVDADVLAGWIANKQDDSLFEYMGVLFLIAVATTMALWFLTAAFRRQQETVPSVWQSTWLGINLLLLGTQFILLPINHGILLLPNSYPMVSITLKSSNGHVGNGWQQAAAISPSEKLPLLHQQDDRFYLYSPAAARVWLLRSSEIESVAYFGMADIFDLHSTNADNP